jgi:hypothetical protein
MQRPLLIVELPILIVTKGLMAWALKILSKSIGYATDLDSRYYDVIPPAYLQSATITQTVTGYRTTSVRPPITFTKGSATSTFPVGFQGSYATQTYMPTTRTFLPATYGIDATATTLRTVIESALQRISHLVVPKEGKNISKPIITPAPVIQKQQASSAVRLGASDFWSVSPTTYIYEQYHTVTVNHGFGRYFLEAGIDHIFLAPYGYSSNDLVRIRALTALVSLALASIIGRIAITVVLLLCTWKKKTVNQGAITAANMAFTILLLFAYIPFWAIYGSWTNRNATVKAADAIFRQQSSYFGLNNLLQSTPWQGTTSAFITFWSLSIVTSLVLSSMSLLHGRRSLKQQGEDV